MQRFPRTATLWIAVAACAIGGAPASEVALETDEAKAFYALGQLLSGRLADLGFSEAEVGFIEAGVRDALLGRESRVDAMAMRSKVDEMINARQAQAAEKERAAAKAFVAQAAGEAGAVTMPSGGIYLLVEEGSGEPPKPENNIKVHYHGTLRDGSVFDSSVERGEPAQFAVQGVIPCFREGLLRMKPGGKAKLTCPPEAAYGDRGSPPKIAGGAAIVFEVELIEVLR